MTYFSRPANGPGVALRYVVLATLLVGLLLTFSRASIVALAEYYAGDPNVTVIVDRRKRSRREQGTGGGGQREVRDRRRPRVTGDFPPVAAHE